MFLRKLTLKNVRSLAEFEMSFVNPNEQTRQWTLLLGENGCGKSTVLRAVALLLAGSEALPELLVEPDSWIRQGQREAVLSAELTTARGELRHIELRLQRGQKIKELFEHNRASLDELDRALDHTARNYLTIGYGVSRRLNLSKTLSPSAGNTFRDPRAQSVATMFSPDALLNPLESWVMDMDYRHGTAGMKLVKQTLTDLLPGVTFDRIDKAKKQLLFKTPDGLLPLGQLSDGYQNVAAWCSDLLYRITEIFADQKKPLAARGLLLIDELDLHLHPLWQRQLKKFITEKLPNFQIIATTHSPLTAHQAGENELYVLQRTPPAAPVLRPFAGDPQKLMLHQLLLSPVFGLTTVDSAEVETMRRQYQDQLKDKKNGKRAVAGATPDAELRQAIADLPDWSAHTPLERKQTALLEKINQALETPAKKRARR